MVRGKGHILIVDDERMILDYAAKLLSSLGYTVSTCSNGLEAIAFFENRNEEIDLVYLLAPTSTEDRIRKIALAASGFVYYVSVKGVTGAGHLDVEAVAAKLAEIRRMVALPVGVGFVIEDTETAAAVAQVADVVVVGSALVSRVEGLAGEQEKIGGALHEVLSSMRQAMDEV